MKKSILSIGIAALVLMMTACGTDGGGNSGTPDSGTDKEESTDESDKSQVGPKIEFQVSGDIDVENIQPGQKGKVSFNRFPTSYAEFRQVKLDMDRTPQGAVALELMAAELYRRNHSEGEEAFKICNTTTNLNDVIKGFKDVFDGYEGRQKTPYQVAAFLEGANWENGYNPTEPYTVNVEVSANGATYSNTYQTDEISFIIFTQGSDSGSRLGVNALCTSKPGEPAGYIISSCPALYAQVREISFNATFNGLK